MDCDVVIVGAGLVGLTVAVLARHEGLDVAVVDHGRPGGGASRGNAGWVSPTLVEPLPSTASLRTALGALRPGSPVRIRPRLDPAFLRFAAGFVGSARPARHAAGARALGTVAALTEPAIADLSTAGVPDLRSSHGLLNVFESPRRAVAAHAALRRHAETVGHGHVGPLLGDAALRELEPGLAPGIHAGFEMRAERFLDPSLHVEALVAAVHASGAALLSEQEDVRLTRAGNAILGVATASRTLRSNAVVVAAGVGSDAALRTAGLRLPLEPGKGYSFGVRPAAPLLRALEVPELHLAITPMHDYVRVAGMMELGGDAQAVRQARLGALRKAARRIFPAADWGRLERTWAGPRPLTAAGLPAIGRSRHAEGLLVATGHAMFGLTLAAATARLVVDDLLGRSPRADLRPFDPDRLMCELPAAGPFAGRTTNPGAAVSRQH